MPSDAIPVILAIDVEPDGKPVGSDDPIKMDGFDATVEWLEQLRPELESATGHPVQVAWVPNASIRRVGRRSRVAPGHERHATFDRSAATAA